jgi:hypothetical protein
MSQLVELKSNFLPKISQNESFTILESNGLTDAIKDYKASIVETVNLNMKLLDEIPLRMEFREELKKRFESMITKDLESDKLFEKQVEIGRYAKDLFNRIDLYFRETFKFNKQRKEKLGYESLSNSRLFLNSDLPLSFLKICNASLFTEMDYIDIFDKEIRKERVELLVSRKNRTKFNRVCERHNAWASKFADSRNAMSHARVKLIWYIDFNNSKTTDEIFKEKRINTSSLDKKTLFAFIGELENQVQSMEKLNLTKTSFDFRSQSDADDGTMTIAKMISTLSNV